jgi:hypothetical protein
MLTRVESFPETTVEVAKVCMHENNQAITLGKIYTNMLDFQDVYVLLGEQRFSLKVGTAIGKTALELLRLRIPNDTPNPNEFILSNHDGIINQGPENSVLDSTWTNVYHTFTHMTILLTFE